tara:strand:- start:4239 stop:5084 length:846 start_codon:yes stop_codon:yes gene_type:complete
MSIVNVFLPTEPDDHVLHLKAFAKGVKKSGDQVNLTPIEEGYKTCDVAVVFGMGKRQVPQSHHRGAIIYEHRFRERKPVVLMERGFIKRGEYYGAALDGLNGLGYFGNANSPSDRWNNLGVKIKRYRDPDEGDHVLVCGQVPWDASVQHTDHMAWCFNTVERLQLMTKREIRFRPHPEVKHLDYKMPVSINTWEQDLLDCHAIVTFSSTSSALAVLDGINIFSMDAGSIAYPISNKELTPELIEDPVQYDRKQWAYDLAYAQWTAEEFETGQAWRQLRDEK